MIRKSIVTVFIVSLFLNVSAIAQPEITLPSGLPIQPQRVAYFTSSVVPSSWITHYETWRILGTWKQRSSWHAGFQAWSCTDYAASKKISLFVGKQGKRLITWNAKERLINAKKLHFATGKTPKKWSIAVYYPWSDGASSYGHVAYVESVQSDGVVVISDMNYRGNYVVTKRTVAANQAAWYIY